MRTDKLIIIVFIVAVLGCILYFVVGISSTFPPIKEYDLAITKIGFEKKITEEIKDSLGWSFKKNDSIKYEKEEVCYWANVSCKENGQQLSYLLKYCADAYSSNIHEECLRVYVIGAFNYTKKSGGYKLSDEGVEELIRILDNKLTELAPACSK